MKMLLTAIAALKVILFPMPSLADPIAVPLKKLRYKLEIREICLHQQTQSLKIVAKFPVHPNAIALDIYRIETSYTPTQNGRILVAVQAREGQQFGRDEYLLISPIAIFDPSSGLKIGDEITFNEFFPSAEAVHSTLTECES